MTTERHNSAQSWGAVLLTLAAVIGVGSLGWEALQGPTVSNAVVKSVRGDGIRIIDVQEATNTGSGDWTNTYVLIEVEGADPVARLASALAKNGWAVNAAEQGSLSLSADRREARLTLVDFIEFQGDSVELPDVVRAFERKTVGMEKGNLFVAVLMPY